MVAKIILVFVVYLPEDRVECGSFTITSINSSIVYENKYYLQEYLDNCAYRIVDKQWYIIWMIIFFSLMKISFLILINGSCKCCIDLSKLI